MSSITLRDLCLYKGADDEAVKLFIDDDSPAGVAHFKTWCALKPKNSRECKNGEDNVLMLAIESANVHLVKYIVEHSDRKVLQLRNRVGMTALFRAKFGTFQDPDRVLACAKILIEAGANIDLHTGVMDKPCAADAVLDENKFKDSNLLGSLIEKLSKPYWLTPSEITLYEALAKVCVSHGAACHISLIGDIKITDEAEGKKTVAAVLKSVCEKAMVWQKTRNIFIGQHDPNSPLSSLPPELITKIFHQVE